MDEVALQKKFSFFRSTQLVDTETRNELIIPRSVPSLWKIPVLKNRLGKARRTGSREGRMNSENLHDTLENSILGNPIEENTLTI